jgi:Acetyl-CoA hydrolase/transferase C-terminal domain
VVTEYGIADLRGRRDEEVATALVEIADSRFRDELIREAKRAGKISEHYRLPEHARHNRPEHLEKLLVRYRERGMSPDFPFGTDLTKEELDYGKRCWLLSTWSSGKRYICPTG